jgi:diguanylate cyclase (GGDEF)-like protein
MVSDELIIYIDELTGLTNRRGFNLIAQHVLTATHRTEGVVSVVMLDLDHFKHINDKFGHQKGDEALQIFGNCMAQVFRESDVVSRLGGDEFCVLLSNTTKETAEKSLDRLRELLDEENADPSHEYKLSFSSGVVESGKFGPLLIENLVGEADRLLYLQKAPKKAVGV